MSILPGSARPKS
jgi:hypothetical protein